MTASPGPRSRPSGEDPGRPLALYEGVDASPDALADIDDKAARRRGRYCHTAPLWCEPPCVLPYHHHGDCFTGWDE